MKSNDKHQKKGNDPRKIPAPGYSEKAPLNKEEANRGLPKGTPK